MGDFRNDGERSVCPHISMSRYVRKCPSCGTNIHPSQIPWSEGEGFPCPACGLKLKSTVYIPPRFILFEIPVVLLVCISLGARTSTTIAALLLAPMLIFFALNAFLAFIFPPPLKPSTAHCDGLDKGANS